MFSYRLLRAFARVACATLLGLACLPAVAMADGLGWGPVSGPMPTQPLALAPGAKAPSGITPDSFTQCPQHYLCMWWDANYSGDFWERSNYDPGPHYANQDQWYYVGNDNSGRLFNDQASSIYCYRPHSSCAVDKDWYPGNNSACLPPQWHASDLSAYVWPDGSGVNDTISSFLIYSYDACQ